MTENLKIDYANERKLFVNKAQEKLKRCFGTFGSST